MTARRTAALEPEGTERIEDRVLFLPGTSFKVLETWRPAGQRRLTRSRRAAAAEAAGALVVAVMSRKGRAR